MVISFFRANPISFQRKQNFKESVRDFRRSGGVLLFQGKWATRGERGWGLEGWFNIIFVILFLASSLFERVLYRGQAVE